MGFDAPPLPPPPIVWQNRVVKPDPATHALTSVSNKLFLNDCLPDGCLVRPGFDSSRNNTSSIAESPVVLDAYRHSAAHWEELVTCVRETFAPFDIEIVTDDPGNTPHFEVMVAGTSLQLNPALEAGGVAPFVGCGASEPDVLSFVFASSSADINYLCAAVVQEASHVWGLDHELDRDDPLTYLDLGTRKSFQNSDPSCGESLAAPRECWCGGATQNTFRYMQETFGLAANLPLPTAGFERPLAGERVAPGFVITPQYRGVASLMSMAITFDGVEVPNLSERVGIWVGPESIASGEHTLTISVTDAAERTVTESITLLALGALGETCESVADCNTPYCGDDGEQKLCATACGEDRACPDGYRCHNQEHPVCWPDGSASADDGGCTTGGGAGSPVALLGALGALVIAAGRRRSRDR